ncbi:MAG: PA14 domain-containing protein, partial [Chloroflexia bacterium]
GGILSVVFEAPQSHRTLENSVVTALIAAIFVGELWTALDARVASLAERIMSRVRKSREHVELTGARAGFGFQPSTLTFAAPALLLLVWIGSMNIDRYFNKQNNDMSVWLEMGGTNKLMALAMAKLGPDYTVYVSPDHAGVPATKYTAPNQTPQVWPGAYILPFTSDRNVELLFAPNDEANVLAVKRVYPNAKVDVGYGPNPDSPQFFEITITDDDIKSVRGTHKIDDEHSLASLKIEQLNSYKFSWQGVGSPPRLMVDGTEVSMGKSLELALGLHSMSLTGAGADFSNLLMSIGADAPAPIGANFLFDPRKVEPRGLTAYLRNGDVFDGPTPIVRVDPQVSFYFHEIPLNRPYTVEWIGKIYAPVAGTYGFTMEQLSRARLFIDEKEVLYNPTPNSMAATRIDLQVGLHDIRIQYEDLDGASHMYLYWTPPGVDPNEKYIIPATFLLPQMGSYPNVPASGAWPTVDQADDTLWARMDQALRTAGAPVPGQADVPAQQQPQGSQPTPVLPPNAIPASLALSGGSTDTLPRPRAAAVDADGNIYIYTELDSKIKKFDKTGVEIAKWDAVNAQGQPSTEGSAMLIRDGKLLFLEAAYAEMVTYSLDGKDEGHVHICDCFSPRGMALSHDGNLWVTDTGFNKVDKVRLDGTFISSVGEKGIGSGQLIEPSSVWESPQGNLFVTDAGNKRVQSFGPDGKPIAQWPMGESTARDGNRLSGTSTGSALLTQYDSKSIIEYAPDGTEKSRWQYEPQGTALIPAGISTAGPNKYLVLFQFDNVAAIFDIGH